MDQAISDNQEDISLVLKEKLKELTSDEVFLKMQQLTVEKRNIIYRDLDNLILALEQESRKFIKLFIGHFSNNLNDKWMIIDIIANAQHEYLGDTNNILKAISQILNKKLKTNQQINWSDYSLHAQELLSARENIYEIQAYPIFEQSLFYLNHFHNNFNSKSTIKSIKDNILLVLDSLLEPLLNKEDILNFNGDRYLEIELNKLNKSNQIIPESIKNILASWRLIPTIEISRLAQSQNRDELIKKLIIVNRVLRLIINEYSDEQKKIFTIDELTYWFRLMVKRNLKFFNYIDHLDSESTKTLFSKIS